jgi:hypothetical protein
MEAAMEVCINFSAWMMSWLNIDINWYNW